MIEKFEKKVNELKEKINKKALGVGVFMVFGALSIFGVEMTNNFKRQKQASEDEYNRAMYEMVGYISNVESELAKLQITNTPKMTSTTLASIWKQSNLAKENLEELPSTQNSMSKASKYLSQVSDYSYSLLKKTTQNEKLNDEEYATIAKLYKSSQDLGSIMTDIYNDLNDGRIRWDELKKVSDEKLSQSEEVTTVSNIEKIGKNFQEYEGLIYDGAFSDHLLNMQPKFLSNNEVTKDQAKENIIKIFKEENIETLEELEDSNGTIDLYNFKLKLKNEPDIKNISMTKKDGKLYLMISDRKVEEEKISMEEAENKGLEFLKSIGIDNVKENYYLKTENFAIINYAALQDNVVLYPDLVKVKVALDTGEICSVEAQGYIFNHTKRDDITPAISIEKARKSINKNLNILSEGVAIIPTESKSEVLTYEFKGKIDEREFLIYVNAKTGEEEKILLILKTEGGTLTI